MIDATASAGLDAAALQSGLAGAMPGFEVVVASDDAARENGAVRVNAATGLTQRFMGGFWLEVPQFDLSLAGCQRSVDAVLNGARIEFQSGSDALDGTAVAVINTLGSYIVRCAEEVGLKAEIGGHTDSQGNVADNLGLSQRRAVAVRKELIARGVPAGALRAQGFGDTVPIADNASEAGRAQNRRTTIVWSQ
jgi:OOP family OmpA-OmpF porin